MPLPSSGSISISQIAAEFGGSAPHSLSEYYRGGGLVPDTPANAAIPTSGAIKLSDFYGASAVTPTITLNPTYSVLAFNPGGGLPEATAIWTLESDGDIIESTTSAGDVDAGDWIDPKSSAPGSYEVRATLVSGSIDSGILNTWLPLSSTRSWSVGVTVAGTNQSATLTVEIRLGGTVLDTTTVDLYAEVAA